MSARLLLFIYSIMLPCVAKAELVRLAEVIEKTMPVYLGTATMADDGTITVSLNRRMTGKNAEEITKYVSGDPSYYQVIGHVGGLKPGETKPVLSWPPGS